MQTLRFPQDLLKFLYWVFFKPITLNKYIHQVDPTLGNNPSLFILWRRSKGHPKFRTLISLSFFHILLTPWLLGFLVASLFALAGFEVDWFGVVGGVTAGVVGGMVGGMAFGVTFGVAFSVAFGLAGGLAGGVAFGVASEMVWNVAGGVAGGVAFGVAFGVVRGAVWGVVWGVVWSVASGVAGVVIGDGVAFGMALSVSCIAGYFRVFLYIFEAPWLWLLSRRSGGDIRFSPVTWDEIIWLPLPGLDQQLVNLGRNNRQKGVEAIAEVASSFRQGWAAKNAVLTLMVDDVEAANKIEGIAGMSGSLSWLPQDTRDEMKSLLLGLDEISRHARAAVESETPYNRQEQLRLGLGLIENAQRGLAADPRWKPGPRLISALGCWEKVFSREYALAQEEKGIPNVYVAGSPLAAQSKVFKGRRDVFRALERELVSHADQRPALLLFGARRMGKTSVLRQLPNAIGPQVIPVMVDLQSIALSENAVSLLAKIAESIQNSALINRAIALPDISQKGLETDPYRAFSDWMETVGNSIGERWILLCLDEFEYLEKLLTDGRIDERAFQLLRTLIQNHPRLTLLFSGAHTLEDLQPMWSNYLINVRIIKIQPLTEDDAETLITKPIPNFPLVYDDEALNHLLFETGCHPYLIQSTCQDLVHRLNEDNRFNANVKDVERALDSALESGTGYFNDLWNGPDSDNVQRAIQSEIAKAKTGKLSISRLETTLTREGHKKPETQAGVNRLIHRDILEQDDSHVQFRFNLIRRWVRYQKLGLK
jgi:hypothetical protein